MKTLDRLQGILLGAERLRGGERRMSRRKQITLRLIAGAVLLATLSACYLPPYRSTVRGVVQGQKLIPGDLSQLNDRAYRSTAEINDISYHPDGNSVIFTVCPSDDCYLMTHDFRTGDQRVIIKLPDERLSDPSYSADGRHIVFAIGISVFPEEPGEKIRLGIVDSDGRNFRTLIVNLDVSGKWMFFGSPQFTPDGAHVIFDASEAFRPRERLFVYGLFTYFKYRSDIYQVRIRDGHTERLTFINSMVSAKPSFWGDGREIIFLTTDPLEGVQPGAPCKDTPFDPEKNPGNLRICVLNLDTGESGSLHVAHPVLSLAAARHARRVLFKINPERPTPEAGEDIKRNAAGMGYSYLGKDTLYLLSEKGVRPLFEAPVEIDQMFRRVAYSFALSPDGAQAVYIDYDAPSLQRALRFDETGPRFTRIDLETGAEEEILVHIPDEEFDIYRNYVKPRMDKARETGS